MRIPNLLPFLLLTTSVVAFGDSYSAEQCPNFASTEQPYLYLYTAERYRGDPLYVTNASISDLGSVRIGASYSSFFNDKASSLRARGKWRICTEPSYGGRCVEVSSTTWKSELMIESLSGRYGSEFNDSISSIKLLSCSQF